MLRNAFAVICAIVLVCPATAWSQPDCDNGTLLANDDDSFEAAYGWEACPDELVGWAECYDSEFICSMRLQLTTLPGAFTNQPFDVYVWDKLPNGEFGTVMCVRNGVELGVPPAIWPEYSLHEITLECCVEGEHYIGYVVNWGSNNPGWYIMADEDGPGGCPRTLVPEGCGEPIGWQHPADVDDPGGSALFPGARALGIREIAETSCTTFPTPVVPGTWGSIKSLY
ncbi:MAG: hypothetical protein GF355_00095 [Candidatus Eisenbacteria bacterium]|nr:hypothetical protein [Candidatus Eisenbacteria bacterium]